MNALHEGGFSIQRDSDGTVHFVEPGGRKIPAAPEPPPVEKDVMAICRADQEARGVSIHSMTAFPRRSFIRPDWNGCVRALQWRRERAEGWPIGALRKPVSIGPD
jgi:hypothetical protein